MNIFQIDDNCIHLPRFHQDMVHFNDAKTSYVISNNYYTQFANLLDGI